MVQEGTYQVIKTEQQLLSFVAFNANFPNWERQQIHEESSKNISQVTVKDDFLQNTRTCSLR